jgi:hypothetical protein
MSTWSFKSLNGLFGHHACDETARGGPPASRHAMHDLTTKIRGPVGIAGLSARRNSTVRSLGVAVGLIALLTACNFIWEEPELGLSVPPRTKPP